MRALRQASLKGGTLFCVYGRTPCPFAYPVRPWPLLTCLVYCVSGTKIIKPNCRRRQVLVTQLVGGSVIRELAIEKLGNEKDVASWYYVQVIGYGESS